MSTTITLRAFALQVAAQMETLPQRWEGHSSMLRPASDSAREVLGLWWLMFAISALVWLIVIGYLTYAVIRGRRATTAEGWVVEAEKQNQSGKSESDHATKRQRQERTMHRAVVTATALTVTILIGYLLYDFNVGRAIAVPDKAPNALHIDIVGHQWWWEVRYYDTTPQRRLTTANEIHVPVNRPVIFHLTSHDVIHSFWIPNLSGKKDLIPGQKNTAWFQADTPGVYRGQCAEFCGHQHANMGILVIAEPPENFRTWYEHQLRPAPAPADSLRNAGQQIFLASTCALCHTIQGTSAGGRAGPDLTHIASRQTIATGMLRNTPDNLEHWILYPQRIKPGTQMPNNRFFPNELRALLAYLEGLQ